jgi:hypothetical protein
VKNFIVKDVFMKSTWFFFLFPLAVFITANGYGQTGSLGKIAILSFSGGSADEREGIAELFSFTQPIKDNFTVIPRTTITTAIEKEQGFQLSSGMTDADTIAKLGNQFGAKYVMAGSITSVGGQNLLIVSIVQIDVIQQVAGDFLLYTSLDELNNNETLLVKMAENLVGMMKKALSDREKLAVLPVQFSGGVNEQEGDALAQLLSIYLLRAGKYAIYPRTKTLEQVQNEYTTQLSGVTRDEEAVSLGRGVNPEYVLSVASRKIGSSNRFNGSIINLEGGNQIEGSTEQYATMSDGMNAMEFLAKALSGIKVSEKERNKRTSAVEKTIASEETAAQKAAAAAKRAAAIDRFLKNSGLNFSVRYGAGFGPGSETEPGEKYIDTKGEEKTRSKIKSHDIGLGAELRLWKYFGFQTGINFVLNNIYTGDTTKVDVDSWTIRIPLLLKLTTPKLGWVTLSAYGGLGINVSTSGDEITSSSPAVLILGADLGAQGEHFGAFVGVQYKRDLRETVVATRGA